MLFGVMASQVLHWWSYGKTDKLLIRLLVVSSDSRVRDDNNTVRRPGWLGKLTARPLEP
jgi:hypothetical protein